MFPEHIFKAYDIRGLVAGELSADLAYRVGRSFVMMLQKKGIRLEGRKVVVGRDMRQSSPDLAQAVIDGVRASGVDVVDIGLTSTPLFNFSCAEFPEHAGGIMVTASHNPGQYNGFKLTLEDGLPIGKNNGMDDLRELVRVGNFAKVEKNGGLTECSFLNEYLNKIFSLVKTDAIKPLKVVVDAGNGMAKVSLPDVISRLPIQVEYLFLEPDGNFPNHEANPLKTETLKDLQAKVLEMGADFGFALDGDADRIGLVNEKGEVVPASYVGGLVGQEVLMNNSGTMMLYDLRSSHIVPELWERNGAKTAQSVVGHALIKKQMQDTGAVFASELSLHLYYRDLHSIESPDLSFLYVCQMLSRGKKLSELAEPLKKYFHSGEINFEIEEKEKVLEKLKEKFGDAKITKLDGLTFEYPDFWFNVRTSNTEPVLRLNLEATSDSLMKEKIQLVKDFIVH
ncbi:MAG: phosphomannomutase/phosphoglucomutase [bacterium]|nr:phosphomannomutase/phosphoglucomutase [bacterium]